jgi:hypothetical protein
MRTGRRGRAGGASAPRLGTLHRPRDTHHVTEPGGLSSMNHKITIAAGLAWAGVVISSASTAGALGMTTQWGEYANCGNSWNYDNVYDDCSVDGQPVRYTMYYRQQIKFIETACNAGGCNSDVDYVYTDFIYPTGRKDVNYINAYCPIYGNVWGIGSCAC